MNFIVLVLLRIYSIVAAVDGIWMHIVLKHHEEEIPVKILQSSKVNDLEIAATHIFTCRLLPFQYLEQCAFRFRQQTLAGDRSLSEVGVNNNSKVDVDAVVRNRWPLTELIDLMDHKNISNPEQNALRIVDKSVRLLKPTKGQRAGVLFDVAGGLMTVCIIKSEFEIYEIPSEWKNGSFVFSPPTRAQKAKLKFLQHLNYCPVAMAFN